MKTQAAAAVAVLLVIAGCATGQPEKGANVRLSIAEVSTPADYTFAGPVNLQFEVTVANGTNEPITLSRIDLATFGSGAYTLRASGIPVNLVVAPGSTGRAVITAPGRAQGGHLSAVEPVSLRGTGYLSGAAAGPFIRLVRATFGQ